jgi:hypothetical protein
MQLVINGPEDRIARLLDELPVGSTVDVRHNTGSVVLVVDLAADLVAVTDVEELDNELVVDEEPEPEEEADHEAEPVEAPSGTLPNNIVRHLKAHGPATTVDIAQAIGAESGDVLAMLRRLREVGKVESAGRSGWKVAARRAFDADAARRRAGQGF